MNTFQLECFFKVAECLNFARAAEDLKVTQPAITHQIHSLENELGVKLFHRTTRSVCLTHEGEVFLPQANDLLIRLHSIKRAFLNGEGEKVALLQICCMSDVLFGLLPDALYNIASAEPNVHPVLRTAPTQQFIRVIEDESADIAIGLKEKMPESGAVKYTELVRTPFVCVCDKTHPLSERNEVRLCDLEDVSLIFLRLDVCSTEIAELQAELGRRRKPSSIYFCDTLTAAFTLAAAGFGALVIPAMLVPEKLTELVRLNVSDYCDVSFGVYYRKNCTPLQRKFIQILKERFKQKLND